MRFQSGNIINNVWKLQQLISESNDYQVFNAINSLNIHVVVKISKNRVIRRAPLVYSLNKEYNNLITIHQESQNIPGLSIDQIPIVDPVSFASHRNYPFMVLHPLRTSLDVILKQNPLKYRTAYLAAFFMVQALEFTHRAGFVHMNLNPSHIITEVQGTMLKFRLGGFRHITRFVDYTSCFALPPIKTNHSPGDVLFSSVNAMSYNSCLPKDDFESLGYCLIYLLRRNLPWSGIDKAQHRDRIIELKQPVHREQMCEGMEVVQRYFEVVDKMDRNSVPEYSELRAIFRENVEELRKTVGGGLDLRGPKNSREGYIE